MGEFLESVASKWRFVIAGLLIILSLVFLSLMIPAAKTGGTAHAMSTTKSSDDVTGMYDDANVVTNGMGRLVNAASQSGSVVSGAVSGGLQSVAAATSQSGKAVGHVGGAAMHGVGTVFHGVGSAFSFTGRTVGGGALFVLRLPVKTAGFVFHTSHVNALITPVDDKPVPVISSETSAAILAQFSAKQQAEIAQLQATQVTENRNLGGTIVAGDQLHGGYPAKWDYPAAQDSRLDTWGMYNRECVSYTAWKVYQTYGDMPYWGGVGNANQWVTDARNAGIPTGSTPKLHSVAISMRGYYGHAMWVEAVNGNMIYVSQYNYDLQGHYSEMWVDGSAFTYIYFK